MVIFGMKRISYSDECYLIAFVELVEKCEVYLNTLCSLKQLKPKARCYMNLHKAHMTRHALAPHFHY